MRTKYWLTITVSAVVFIMRPRNQIVFYCPLCSKGLFKIPRTGICGTCREKKKQANKTKRAAKTKLDVWRYCTICGKTLSEYDKKIGVATHKNCWKAWVDNERSKRFHSYERMNIYDNPERDEELQESPIQAEENELGSEVESFAGRGDSGRTIECLGESCDKEDTELEESISEDSKQEECGSIDESNEEDGV